METSQERLQPPQPTDYPNVYQPDPRLAMSPGAQGSPTNGQSNYFIQEDDRPSCNGYSNPLGLSNNPPVGSLGIENGCININVPCSYTYPFEPQPAEQKKKKKHKHKIHKKQPSQQQPAEKPVTIRLECSSSKATPFCSTVRSDLCGPPSKGYIAKSLPPSGGPVPKGQNKTKIKWDYETDCKIPVRGVDYGEELYQLAALNFARQKQIDIMNGKYPSGKSSNSGNSDGRCPDFSTPAFNSSLKKSNELAVAVEGLKNLPVEIERMFKADKRFDAIILDKASRTLNTNSKSKVFKNLVPVEPNNDVVNQLSKAMLQEVQSVRPLPRSRDPEPNLLDFQQPSFSRMKPKAVAPPTKRTSGVRTELSHNHHMIESENRFEEEGNRMSM